MARLRPFARRAVAVALVVATCSAAAQAGDDAGALLTLRWDGRDASARGPLAAAAVLQGEPASAYATPSAARAQAELRASWRPLAAPSSLALHGNALLAHERPEGRGGQDASRVNELHAAVDLGAWQLSAGKRVLGWDVGYGFRPNDIVQQEERRTQLEQTPEGRTLLQVEHFGAATAWSLVWVQPTRWHDPAGRQRGARESALAARAYVRAGALDLHGFARHGRHTGASVGGAAAWVATDALELHASARVMQRHDGWQFDPAAGDTAVRSNPWQVLTRGGRSQWLLGGQWTGEQRQSLLVEWWRDGTALADDDWQRWRQRNAALAQAAPAPAAAGNLRWQAEPMQAANLRRENLFVRLAWQPEGWLLSLDALATPADRGRVVTASLQWRGQRLTLDAGLRRYGGPADALLAQVPLRRSVLLAATLAL